MKVWRFGIVGCGGIADFHIKAIKGLENAVVTAVASRSRDKAEKAGRLAGCEWMTDYREMLRRPDIDIVSVTASSGSHAAIGREALQAGKHLVLEKPMAMKADHAAELVRLAHERNLTLSVISQRRFEPQHRTVKRLIDEGALGRLLLIEASVPFLRSQAYYDSADWRGTLREDGGALMNQGIHSVDLMLWLAGIPETVYGKTATQTHRMEAEDLGLAILRFRSGCLGTLMASTSIQPGLQTTLHVYGETGTIKIIGSEIALWCVPGIEQPQTTATAVYGGEADPLSINYIFHQQQLADIVGAIVEGREPAVTGQQGWQSVRLIEALYESAAIGGEVRFPDPLQVFASTPKGGPPA